MARPGDMRTVHWEGGASTTVSLTMSTYETNCEEVVQLVVVALYSRSRTSTS